MIEDGYSNRDGDAYTPSDGHPLLRFGQGSYQRDVTPEPLPPSYREAFTRGVLCATTVFVVASMILLWIGGAL